MCHVPHQVRFHKSHFEMIMNGATEVQCRQVLHPGQSCTHYALLKLLLQTKTALKVATIFVLLPAAVKNIKKMY